MNQESPIDETFLSDLLIGMRLQQKQIPSKYFYDQRGCELFEEICLLDEYYLTRTELAIMDRHAAEMARRIGPRAMLVELGSGSSKKTRILLEHLEAPVAYVPVDIAGDHLHETVRDLNTAFVDLDVVPLCADFMSPFELPRSSATPDHTFVYFPGSTVGNLAQHQTEELLRRVVKLCGSGGGFLLGMDLQKDVNVIEAAYNDGRGVTAQFNLNILHRANRELPTDFQLEKFAHRAFYNSQAHRIEMHLVSLADQTLTIADDKFQLKANETIRTEYSHKYDLDSFAEMAKGCGLKIEANWQDEQSYFAVVLFRAS